MDIMRRKKFRFSMFKVDKRYLLSKISNSYLVGENIMGDCPVCGHNEFGISIKSPHLWQCFRKNKCGVTGNIFTLLRYLRVDPDDVPIHAVDYIDFKIRDVFDYGSRVHELKYLNNVNILPVTPHLFFLKHCHKCGDFMDMPNSL